MVRKYADMVVIDGGLRESGKCIRGSSENALKTTLVVHLRSAHAPQLDKFTALTRIHIHSVRIQHLRVTTYLMQ